MSSHQKVPEKSLVSPSSSQIKWRERCWEDIRQQTWRQVKKPVSSINYARVSSNQWIHSVSACGRWTTLVGSQEPLESDLFSKLVCLISPAWCWKAEHASVIFQMQEIAHDILACEIGLCELKSPGLLAFFSSEWGQKGAGFSEECLSMPVGPSNSSMRLFCSMNWPLGLGRDVGGLLRCDLRDGLSGLFCQKCSPSQDDVPSSTRGCFQWSLASAVTPSNHQRFWDS